ncbi:MAG: OmpA family protein, partial [Rhodospirillales bacterium]|nr:OmpA family protein [Rhodospirillales bacterium]
MIYFSRNFLRAGALLAAALLAGCSGMELDRAQSLSPQGSAFSKGLFSGYIKLSKTEFAEFDYTDSDTFAMRAAASTKGTDVFPEDMSMRKLPKNKVGELSSARSWLMTALSAGGRDNMPGPAAHAQVMFDCWMQEQEENFQPDDIAACRAGFFSALAKIETMPMKMAAKPMHKPMHKPMKKSRKFVVYFGFNSAGITNAARKTIMEVIAVAKGIKAKRVYVTGHTDRSGAGNYNLDLSERRA